ncbi:MAG TPA: TonB-dependent receptor [Verrucomicrobiae bacterium]|nr:TonB-dependent receptor [Verrucomicrobiae bacterium]
MAADTGAVAGIVTDANGAPLAAATVDLRGPAAYTTQTDASGAFAVASVVQGLYAITVLRAGFETATDDIAVVAGQSQNISVRLNAASFSSLRTIARVSVNGRGTFNTTPASVNVISAQVFRNQAQPQIRDVLNEIPGIQISLPGGSANGAAPGAITVPTIRGAASYETASLIDGHPLAVEGYGDYVTTFLNSFMFSNVEVIKGPGATAPEVNNAINGTVNFRTKDPTLTATPDYQIGFNTFGGTWANFGIADTVGRLGFVVDVANLNDPSVLNGKSVFIDPSGYYLGSSSSSDSLSGNATYTTIPNTESSIQTGYSLLACCYKLQGYLDSNSELVKLRYHLSSSANLTVSYLGGQAYSDQTSNVGNVTNATFIPGAGYTGSLAPGAYQVAYLYPANVETNNEPMFQAEFSSSIGRDTILARYYHASIYRDVNAGSDPNTLAPYTLNVSGASSNQINTFPYGSYPATYNGANMTVYSQNYFRQVESDKLAGWSFQYAHPFATGDNISLGIDQTNTQGESYQLLPTYSSISLPQGSSQLLTTVQLRAELYLTPRIQATLADYVNVYRSTYPASCPFAFGFSNCAIDGSNVTFATTTTSHNDPRLALEFRPNPNLAVRFAAGSAIAPPYLGLLSQISAPTAAYDPTTGIATITRNSGQLKAETAFGFDLGADWRLRNQQTIVSGDIYSNNLFNHYFGQSVNSGTVCGTPTPCFPAAPVGTPVYYQTTTNISNFRFQGVELSIGRHPVTGLGYTLSGGLQRGYVYNLPMGFYCSHPVASCINNPSNWDQNLNIIAGQNLNGEGAGSVSFYPYFGFSSTVGSLNTREPYSQAYGELSYTLHGGGYVSFGDTYYGNNNSFNQRPFLIANATVRFPIAANIALQVSGENLFNTLAGYFPIYGGGLPIPLANGGSAATTGNVFGPAIYTMVLTKRLP